MYYIITWLSPHFDMIREFWIGIHFICGWVVFTKPSKPYPQVYNKQRNVTNADRFPSTAHSTTSSKISWPQRSPKSGENLVNLANSPMFYCFPWIFYSFPWIFHRFPWIFYTFPWICSPPKTLHRGAFQRRPGRKRWSWPPLRPHRRRDQDLRPQFQKNVGIRWFLTGLVLLGKYSPETHGFLPSNWLGFPVRIVPSSNSMNFIMKNGDVIWVSWGKMMISWDSMGFSWWNMVWLVVLTHLTNSQREGLSHIWNGKYKMFQTTNQWWFHGTSHGDSVG